MRFEGFEPWLKELCCGLRSPRPERRIGVERISAPVGDGGPASGMQTVETTLFPEARPVPDRLQQNAISPPA